MLVSDYRAKVKADHKSKAVRLYFLTYEWFWFNTQWWLNPVDRRPYTFIFRDWIYPHMKWFLVILAIWYAGMFTWLAFNPWPSGLLLVLSSWLAAHLIWGACWIPNQQEDPPYMGEVK